MRIPTNKLNLFLLAVALVLFLIVFIIAVSGFFSPPAEPSTPTTSTSSPSPTRRPTLSPPRLQAIGAPQEQGVFTVAFAKAPNPAVFTTTLSTSPSQPPFTTKAVLFTTEFKDSGKQMVITTTEPLLSGNIYTLYVRLKSNNHIVVKHRYEIKNGELVIIDNN